MIDVAVLRLLLLTIIGWLDSREREALAYLIEESASIPFGLKCVQNSGTGATCLDADEIHWSLAAPPI